jgi:hypothetical protein
VRRRRAVIALVLALVALALPLAACGGDDNDAGTTTSAVPSSGVAPPGGGAAPPSTSELPPALVKCFADQGFNVESATEIHSAPPAVVQACFESFHQGGGGP